MVNLHIVKIAIIADRRTCTEVALDCVVAVVSVNNIGQGCLDQLTITIDSQSQIPVTVMNDVPRCVRIIFHRIRDVAQTNIGTRRTATLHEKQLSAVCGSTVIRYIDILCTLSVDVTDIIVVRQNNTTGGRSPLPFDSPRTILRQRNRRTHLIVGTGSTAAANRGRCQSIFCPSIFRNTLRSVICEGPVEIICGRCRGVALCSREFSVKGECQTIGSHGNILNCTIVHVNIHRVGKRISVPSS